MHTPILSMCVLLPFGVNNPASLVIFLGDRPYDTKSEYMTMVLFLKITTITDQECVSRESEFDITVFLTTSLIRSYASNYLYMVQNVPIRGSELY